jgi:hypothetical protein
MNKGQKNEPTPHGADSNKPSFFAIIPAHVRYCRELEFGARLLYGELTALTNQYGYCWASNEYFATLYEVDIRTIQLWIKSLKKCKFIIIEVIKQGFKTSRKIWISPESQKMFARRKNLHGRHEKNFAQGHTSHYYYNNTQRKNSSSRKPPSPPPRRPPPITFDLDKRSFAGISDDDINAWKAKFPMLDISSQLALCAEWAIAEPRKNYRRSIIAWLTHSSKQSTKKQDDNAKEHKAYAEKIHELFKKLQRSDIVLGFKYIEFINGMTVNHVEFGQKDFREQCDKELRKRKLNL